MSGMTPSIRAGIFAGESGGDYNALYGYQNRPGGKFAGTNLMDMTVNQAIDFSNPNGPYGQWVKSQIGRVATPMGAYQIVGKTLRAAKDGLGLTGQEKMNRATQDRLGDWIYQTQGTGAWEGYRGPGDPSTLPGPNQGIADATMRALGKMSSAMPSPSLRTSDHPPKPRMTPMQFQEPKQREHLFFKNMSTDTRDRLTIALSGMSMNPNLPLVSAARDRLDDRREERRNHRRGSRTAEWLMTQPGGEQFAQGILSGAISGNDGLRMWQKATSGTAQTAKQQQIERIKAAYGVDDRTAVGIADNVLNVSRDPYNGTVVVTNLATGESYAPTTSGQQPAANPSQPAAIDQAQLPPGPDASNAFGGEGMFKGALNSAADFLGMAPPFEGVQQTQSEFAVLREGLVNDIAQGYGRQPPSWLLKNIQELTPEAGGMMGANAAQSKLTALQSSFAAELDGVRRQMEAGLSPQEQRVLSQRAAALQSALQKVQGAIGKFGSPGNSGNQTKTGIKWSVEQ